MKKIMKFILGFVAVVFIIMVVFWGSFVYISEYKITKADTSVSPDKSYELVLQAVGEADFPFGSALGRLILYEGKSKISKADFELFDDGGCIRSSIWEVTWHEDCVKVILSGDEQLDEQIILYFDGRKEVKQLTDWDKYGEAWDVSESGEIILRPNGVSEYMVLGALSGMTSLCMIPHSSRSCNCCDSIFGVAFGIMRLRDSKHSGRTPADRVTPSPGVRELENAPHCLSSCLSYCSYHLTKGVIARTIPRDRMVGVIEGNPKGIVLTLAADWTAKIGKQDDGKAKDLKIVS